MMRRVLVPLFLLAWLALPAGAHAAVAGSFFPGVPIDGPSADIQRLGELDVARDGSGALAYVRRDGGVDHVFVSRFVGGAWQAPERVDPGLDGPSSQPVLAAADGGRIVVAYVNGGSLFSVMRAAGSAAFTNPTLVSTPGINPSVDMSINGVAYLSFTAPGLSAADVRAARMEGSGSTFAALPDALDIDGARDAGVGGGRSRVAVSAEGTAVVTWGEAGRVYARRLFEARLSTAPQDLTLDELEGFAGGAADVPDIESEDDSSYAWVVFRQAFQDGAGGTKTRAIARRLVGSQFEAPAVVDGQAFPVAENVTAPRLALNGRGEGYAALGGESTAAAVGAVLKDDLFFAGVTIGGGFGAQPFAAPAVTANGDGLIAFQQGEPGGARSLHARPYDNIPASRAPTAAAQDVLLSDPALGSLDAARGLEAGADRAGDVAVVTVQGEGEGRYIVGAAFDRAPGTFRTFTTSRWRRFARPPLTWGESFELWGPLTYRVEVDGRPIGETGARRATFPTVVRDGEHTWRVVAIDRRGQSTATPVRLLRVDARRPAVRFRVSGTRKRGRAITVTVNATDATGTDAKASGIKQVRVQFGDGTRAVYARRAVHRFGRSGRYIIRVSAQDRAGNAVAVKRRVRITR